jgi:hypothetical protein
MKICCFCPSKYYMWRALVFLFCLFSGGRDRYEPTVLLKQMRLSVLTVLTASNLLKNYYFYWWRGEDLNL